MLYEVITCVGLQLLFNEIEEDNTQGLSLIPGDVCRFDDTQLTVPHMGWNQVEFETNSPLFYNINQNSHFYFVP